MTIDKARRAKLVPITLGESGDQVWFVDCGEGYFLKSGAAGSLVRAAEMTRYFHGKGLGAQVLDYASKERDWLLTAKVPGEASCAAKYLEQPQRLCDILAEQLVMLHSLDYTDCPVNHTAKYLAGAERNYRTGNYVSSHFPDSFGYVSAEEALQVIQAKGHLLQADTLVHGDYCLPNVMLDNWAFSGFIDLGDGGVGDRHVDIFWALWSLGYNLKTDKHRQRFIDAYGRENIDDERLQVIAAAEVFG